MRGAGNQLLGVIICAPLFVLGMIFFLPIAIAIAAIAIYYFQKWIRIVRESYSGSVRQAACPSCSRLVNFWVSTGFACPYCLQALLQHNGRLYEV
jgi:hypothetical protein